MNGQLTAMQLGALLKQRRYSAPLGVGTDAISLDGGVSWWQFYVDNRLLNIGGPIDRDKLARDEWNPVHAGVSYSVTEVLPDTPQAILVVRFCDQDMPLFVFKVRNRAVQLVLIDREGQMTDTGVGVGQTLASIEFIGPAHIVIADWESLPKRIVRER